MAIDDDIKEIRDDVQKIKQDIGSINRVQVLAASTAIMQDIRSTVKKSKLMVAILFLTKDWMSSSELADAIHSDVANLNKFINPLIDRNLLYRERRGNKVYFRRVETVNLVGFDSDPEFKTIFETWNASRGPQE